MSREIDAAIAAEATTLEEEFRASGQAGLTSIVIDLSRNPRDSIYFLSNSRHSKLAGNLAVWPSDLVGRDGWIDFTFERAAGSTIERRRAHARQVQLSNGSFLLVGNNLEGIRQLDQSARRSLYLALGLTLVFAMVGGLILARRQMRRVETIARSMNEVVTSDFSQRIMVSDRDDEIDRIATSLNTMLDRTGALVDGIRAITDDIAHELRQPLNRLRNRLELVSVGEPSVEEYRATIMQTIDEADGLIGTFNLLLKIAEIESGIAEVQWEELDLGGMVRKVADFYQPVAEDRGLSIVVEAEDDVTIRANSNLLSHAFNNIVDNAIKYSPEGGTIVASVGRTSESVIELAFADNGPGIPESDRERVLERFVRLDVRRQSPGNGLGLSLVKAVTQSLGADLRLKDNRPGLRVVLKFSVDPTITH